MALDKVTVGVLADNAVTTAKVADDAVTNAKIGADAVGTTEIANDASISTSGNIATTGSGKLTLAGDFIPSTPLSSRNIIINGAMRIAQRGDSATDTGGAGFYHTADRMFNFDNCVAANFTRTTTAADGVLGTETGNTFGDKFQYSWKFASNGTVSSIPASDRVFFAYKMEGRHVQHLAKGSAAAKPVTLSFWVKSTQTGNHQVNFVDNINTRQIGAVYAVSSANTWEKKVITFAGDTTGIITDVSTLGMSLEWWLTTGTTYTTGAVPTSWEANVAADRNAGGAANYVGGSGRTWQITGIQLEVGSNATPFEHKRDEEELLLCRRYYVEVPKAGTSPSFPSLQNGSTNHVTTFYLDVPLRAAPTLVTSGTPTFCRHNGYQNMSGTTWGVGYTPTAISTSRPWVTVGGAGLSGGADMHAGMVYGGGATFKWNAEL